MKLKVGDIVKLPSSMSDTFVRNKYGVNGTNIGVFRQGEIAIIIKIDDPSTLQVQLITSNGVIGWVIGAWLETIDRS